MAKAIVELANFTESEAANLSDELMLKLQVIRELVGAPIHITSGYRMGDDGAHGLGQAVDISDNQAGEVISSRWRFAALGAALAVGFNRIGVYDRHIHLDISTSKDQDVCWWGVSK